jgi:hypothetical protein
MATGKTHSRYVKVIVDDSGGTARDVSASVDTLGGIGLTFDDAEVTTFADSIKQYLTGYGNSEITMGGPFNNTATTGAHTVMSGIAGSDATSKTLTIQIGIRAAPTTGDPEWEGEYTCSEYLVNADGVARWTARFRPALGASTPAWGTVS